MASNLEFIQRIDSGGLVSNFDLQNIFGKDFQQYEIHCNDLNGGGNGGYVGLRFYDSSNSLISGSEYRYGARQLKGYGSFDNTWLSGGSKQSQIAPIAVGINDDNNNGGWKVMVFSADDSSAHTFVLASSSTVFDSGLDGNKTMGVHQSAEAITGIRFVNQSVTRHTIANIYGVK